jgi:hypothetical protein
MGGDFFKQRKDKRFNFYQSIYFYNEGLDLFRHFVTERQYYTKTDNLNSK